MNNITITIIIHTNTLFLTRFPFPFVYIPLTGCTALMKAAIKGYTKIMTLLIAYEADVSTQNHKGHTALMFACKSGICRAVEVLVRTQALDVNKQSSSGMTALMAASGDGHLDIVDYLLTVPTIDILLTNHKGETCYDYARNGNFREVMNLLRPLFMKANQHEIITNSPHWSDYPHLSTKLVKGSQEFFDAYFQEVVRGLHDIEDQKLTIDVYDKKHHIMVKQKRPIKEPFVWSKEVAAQFNERLESDCKKRRVGLPPPPHYYPLLRVDDYTNTPPLSSSSLLHHRIFLQKRAVHVKPLKREHSDVTV